jgi:hypothetical protein
MRQVLGYACVSLAVLGWGTFLVLPLVAESVGTAAAEMTAVLVVAEVSFLAGVALLGRETWTRLKGLFRRRR